MSRRTGLDAVIRSFAWTAAVGGTICFAALVCGVLGIVPGGAAAGFAFGGFLLFAAGVRQVTRARRLRAQQQDGRHSDSSRA